jgi:type VI secretion system ImpC/EvpB family protein/type VI secretion system ImpB/VipA family protein
VNSDDKKEGGFVVGGISFGVGPSKPIESGSSRKAAPVERDEALMPLRVLAVGDFIPKNEHNAGINAPDHPVTVEPAGLDALFGKLSPRVALEVESVLHDGGKVRVDVNLNNLQSFRPDGLCREVPLLRSLLDGKKVLERLRDGTVSVEAAASELSRLWNGSPFVSRVLGGVEVKQPQAGRPAAAPAASDDAMDRILGLVDTGTTADAATVASSPEAMPATMAAAGSGKFDAFIAAVAHSGKDRPGARPDEAIRLIEKAVSLQLGAILQHPELRRLEEAWRGLAFVVGRMPKTGVRLDVLSCRKDDAPDALARAAAANPGIDPPISFAIVDGAVGSDAASLAWLRAVADAAEANTIVALTNAAPSLLGQSLDAIDRLDNKQALFDAPERAPWRAEAHRPAMLWVSLAVNRVLARLPYDTKTSRVREAQVGEQPADDGAVVWMQPAWAVASLAIKSFARYEWPCGIIGARNGGVIEDLPVREIALRSGEKIAIPTEAFFSTETQRAIGRLGILGLAAQPNSDSAYLLSAATAYVTPPKRTYDDSTAEPEVRLPQASLVDQLFVARLAQYLNALGSRISRDESAGDIEKFLEAAVHELFRNAPPSGPVVTVNVSGGQASVKVEPRRFLGVSMEEITLGVPLA